MRSPSRLSRSIRASRLIPDPASKRKSRREIDRRLFISVDVDELVCIQHHVCQISESLQLGVGCAGPMIVTLFQDKCQIPLQLLPPRLTAQRDSIEQPDLL